MKPLHFEKLKALLQKYKYILAVVGVGIFFLLLPSGTQESKTVDTEPFSYDRVALQTEMEQVLSHIEGVGRLRLMLTVDATEEKELAQNGKVREDRGEEGVAKEEESTVVTVHTGSNLEEVVVKRSLFPNYVGALVVCEGGGSAAVRLRVMEAVHALTGLSTEKISVIKGKP